MAGAPMEGVARLEGRAVQVGAVARENGATQVSAAYDRRMGAITRGAATSEIIAVTAEAVVLPVPGQTCFRDSANNPGCRAGSGGSPTTTNTHVTTTQVTTRTTAHTTTATGTPPTTIAGGTGPSTVPTPPAGSQDIVIDVSSEAAGITWTGEWNIVPSSCSSAAGSKARLISGIPDMFKSGLMSYSFTGACIYVSVVSSNAEYTIIIDGEETHYGTGTDATSTPTPANCTFGWSQTNLTTGLHFIGISVLGAIGTDTRWDIELPWSLEIQNLVITQPISSVGRGGGAESGSSATASAKAGKGEANAGFGNIVSWFWLGIFTIFVVVTTSICI
ncbi:hypothetical protein B0H14DRAFT_3893852 [Mycena olivaceomarginata]|nr:hypothetical protein B0H14DRAFT_3893852 [Mycena olivaceomarginata]